MRETSVSLLERARDPADRDAWNRLVELYAPLLGGWLRRHGAPRPDIDDLVQDVLVVLMRRLPEFRHNGRAGAFRHWLRSVMVHSLRRSARARRRHPDASAAADLTPMLDQLEDAGSHLSRLWDREHDLHVARRLLAWVEPEVRPDTWRAFWRQVLEGASAAAVAAELGISPNAALIAKSRVLKRLREHGVGFIDSD